MESFNRFSTTPGAQDENQQKMLTGTAQHQLPEVKTKQKLVVGSALHQICLRLKPIENWSLKQASSLQDDWYCYPWRCISQAGSQLILFFLVCTDPKFLSSQGNCTEDFFIHKWSDSIMNDNDITGLTFWKVRQQKQCQYIRIESLACSVLLFGVPVGGVLQRLQVVQNNAVRVAHCLSLHVYITPMLKELHWLPIEQP